MDIRKSSSRHPNSARDLVREPLTAEELNEHLCVVCGASIGKNHLVSKRKDALTCSDRCRKRRERRGKPKTGLRITENKAHRLGQIEF
jgi:predicted nucleic acid-binding Zn ribbon protein